MIGILIIAHAPLATALRECALHVFPDCAAGVLALDTGCVWGGCLTAARMGATPGSVERISVRCPQARAPEAM
jgi:hypothetical protein